MTPVLHPRRTAPRDTERRGGHAALHPIGLGAVIASCATFLTVAFVFAPDIGIGDLAWSAAVGVCVGIAATAAAIGRRVRVRPAIALGLTTMAMTPAAMEVALIADALRALGLTADRRYWWRWVDTGDTAKTLAFTPGVLGTAMLAIACGVVIWRIRKRPAVPTRPIHPLVAGAVAAGLPVIVAIDPGYDPALTPFLAAYAVITGMGGAAIAIGAHLRRHRLVVAGSVTVAALPVAHAIGLLAPIEDQWAPTLVHDALGVVFMLVGAAATAAGLVAAHRSARGRGAAP